MKLIKWHKNLLNLFKRKTGLSDYQIAWIAFAKGLLFGWIIKACL